MKNVLYAIFTLSLLTACSNPVLKWIDTPEELGGNRNGDKEITDFSFGIDGESVIIGSEPDSNGETPIWVILPKGTAVNSLTPKIEYIGKFLNPLPGRSTDFSAPRPYMVTAEDGSTREYLVRVSVKDNSSKDILHFAIVLPSALVAEGIIDETTRTIDVWVPSETNLSSISARIAHNGVSLTDPNQGIHGSAAVNFSGDFSAPTIWIVTDEDELEKSYTVTVNTRDSSDKEITAFSLGIIGESVIIGSEPRLDGQHLILVFVPAAGNLVDLTPGIEYKGKSISPEVGTSGDFSDPANPVVYTVTAQDNTDRDYIVRVVFQETGGASDKRITGFYFTDPLVEGVINETTRTIVLTVPPRTNTIQRPEIYYIGASVSPTFGQPVDFSNAGTTPVEYRVTARDGTSKIYAVTVNKRDSSDKEIIAFSLGFEDESVTIGSQPQPDGKYLILAFVPDATATDLANLTPALVYNGSFISPGEGILRNFSDSANPVVYRVTAEDGSFRDYVIRVVLRETGGASDARITGFYFTDPLIEGVINESANPKTITLTVPPETNIIQRPEIYSTGAVSPASGESKDFTTPVDYTVTADGTTATYKVTVNKRKSSDKEITAFGFGFAGESVIIGSEPQSDGRYPILALVPGVTAVDLAQRTPALVYKADSISPGVETPGDFSDPKNPVVYRVTAEDGSFRDYVVKVVFDETSGNSDARITGFYFINPLIEGVINESAEPKTITLTVPQGTNTIQWPEIYFTGASVSPASGRSVDFSNAGTTPVKYTVTAADGVTKKDYAVTVTVNKLESSDKEITAFGFGIAGESVIIGSEPQPDGRYPILALVPGAATDPGMNLAYRTPALVYKGSSIALINKEGSIIPGEGIPGDFSDLEKPVVYRVTAEDGSSRDYVVKVVFNGTGASSDKKITGFYFTNPLIEGVISDTAGTIALTVPQGTNTIQRPEIYFTGASVSPTIGQSVDFSSAGTTPVEYTVTAADGTKKTYAVTVTVYKQKSSNKEITAFGFGFAGESVIIGSDPQPDGKYPILVLVPGAASDPAMDLANRTPGLIYRGSSISPGEGTPGNFSDPVNPVVYTVTAEDLSSRDYVIRVIFKETGASSAKQITGFYFADPLIEGVINESAKTIALTVPQGTNTIQRPEIYYTGASVSPLPGQSVDFSSAIGTTPTPVMYTVKAQDGSSETYRVYVSIAAIPTPPVITIEDSGNQKVDIGIDASESSGGGGSESGNYTAIVEMPIHINNPVININYPGAGNTVNIGSIDASINPTVSLINNDLSIINNNVFNYVPIELNNGEYLYVLAVNPPSGGEPAPQPDDPDYDARQAAASIDGFYFANPVAVGTINQTTGAIEVKVPYGTDLRNLAASICYTGKEIVGIPGANPLKAGARSFAGPVDYTVKSYNDGVTKTYRVTVTPADNTAKDITAFGFTEVNPVSIVIGGSPNAEEEYPILITVPDGQSRTSLTPVITHTGVSIEGPTGGTNTAKSPITDTPRDFSSAVNYTVKAEDDSTKTYAVTVRNAGASGADDDIAITGFYFTTPLAAGIINQDTNTIAVIVPSATNTASLVPSVYFKGMTVNPGSGRTNNFNGPVIYTVTGVNGKTRPYTVTVTKTPSSSKDLTRFDFPGVTGSETVIGAVPNPDGSYPVSVCVPSGTALGNLAPDIVYSGISIGPSAGVPQNFNVPQTYTITAEDGSTKTYKVTTTTLSGSSKLITSLVFNEVPLSGGGTIRVVAAIDGSTITATVPSTASINGLAPTITYIGKSISGPSGGDQTANPFTDAARNFGGPQTYTVKDQSGDALDYIVRVQRQSTVKVTFEGDKDLTVIGSNVFDQNTGIITITAAGTVGPPYEWYVDGVKQGVSSTEPAFTLNVGTGNFTPGRHEIMLSGKSPSNGLHYTGKVSFTVAGGSK